MDKQTDKQTDSKFLPRPTDIVGVSNNNSWKINWHIARCNGSVAATGV